MNNLGVRLNAILALAACTRPTPTTTPEVMTATRLSPEENMEKYGIPAVIVPFDYPVPDGMIEAKIAHLQEVNRLFWGDAPGTPEERQAIFDEAMENTPTSLP